MKPIYQIRIAEPCQEDWEKMSPTERGKFCAACQKQVVDFTSASDKELVRFIESPHAGICGRFLGTQLERSLIPPQQRKRWWLYWFGIAASAMMTISRGEAQTVKGRVSHQKTEQRDSINEVIVVGKMSAEAAEAMENNTVVSGIIKDERNEPVPNASIVLKGTKLGTRADVQGYFTLEIGNHRNGLLDISSVGFERREISVPTMMANYIGEPVVIKLKQTFTGMMGEVVVTSRRKRWFSGLFRKDSIKTCEKPAVVSMVVYPNPVVAGAAVNLVTKGLPAGRYFISLMDMSGYMVDTKMANLASESSTTSFPIRSTLKPGTYIIRLNGNGKALSAKLMLQ